MAALLECPTRKDLPAYQYSILLDGVTFILAFKFNDRMNKWMLTIGDVVGNPIISGIPLVANWPLIDRFKRLGQPAGTLIAFDTSGEDLDPGRFDLGDRVKLFYLEAGGL